jgi:hypothetical protein
VLLLISGRPGTGKSEFCRWLAENRGFTHIEVDSDPDRWGRYLEQGTLAVARELSRDLRRSVGRDVAFEWGFPPGMLDRVGLLRKVGFEPWWFDGDPVAARQGYEHRQGPINPADHESQLEAIRKSWKAIEREFDGRIIQNVSPGPTYLPPEEVAAIILASWEARSG